MAVQLRIVGADLRESIRDFDPGANIQLRPGDTVTIVNPEQTTGIRLVPDGSNLILRFDGGELTLVGFYLAPPTTEAAPSELEALASTSGEPGSSAVQSEVPPPPALVFTDTQGLHVVSGGEDQVSQSYTLPTTPLADLPENSQFPETGSPLFGGAPLYSALLLAQEQAQEQPRETSSSGSSNDAPEIFAGLSGIQQTPTFSIASASIVEGGAMLVTITRSGPAAVAQSVEVSTQDGTAMAPADYTALPPTTLTFAPNQLSQSIIINTVDNALFDGDLNFIIRLSNPTGGGVLQTAEATGTIFDNEATFQVTDAQAFEGGGVVFTITRTGGTNVVHSVNFATGDGTATLAGNDYVNRSGTLTFNPGATSQTVTVVTNDDATAESDETFTLTLSAPTGGAVLAAPGFATGTILDNDSTVSVAVAPGTVTEDLATNLVYTFTRTGDTSGARTVNFDVAGTADFVDDYAVSGAAGFTANAGTVTFGAGNATATVTIDPVADTTVESDETVALTLAPGAGYIVGAPATATGTIVDDDIDVNVSVAPLTVTEDGATNLVYTFTRTGVTTTPLTVNLGVGGNATLNTDYSDSGADAPLTPGGGTISFAANVTSVQLTVDPTADATLESDETVVLTVLPGAGYSPGATATATGTIVNDDTDVTVTVSPLSTPEDAGPNLVYTFTRTGITTDPITVNFDVAGSATLVDDFVASGAASFGAATGTVNFAAGASTATVTIDSQADTLVEGDETVVLTVAPGTGYNPGAPVAATGTIVDDDKPNFSISVSSTTASEAAPGTVVFTVTRLDASGSPVTDPRGDVDIAITLSAPAGVGGATVGSDYTVAAAGNLTVAGSDLTLRFGQGSTSEQFTVNVLDDQIVEPSQSFTAAITGVDDSPGGIGGFIANPPNNLRTVTISDDDTASFAVSPAAISQAEGTGAGSDFVYTVTRTTPAGGVDTGLVQTIDFTAVGSGANPATAGTDFSVITPLPVSFASGDTTKTVTVRATGDSTVENDETFTVTASVASSGGALTTVTTPTAGGTITNDDATSFSVSVAPATRGEESGQGLVYTVTRTGSVAPGVVQLIDVTLAGTATVPGNAGADYSLSGLTVNAGGLGTLNFGDADTSKSFTVTPVNDTAVEGDETVSATLAVNDDGVTSAAAGAVVGTGSVSGTIVDDDKPTFSITASAATASEAAPGTVVFTVTRLDSLSNPVADPLGDVDVSLVLSAPAGVGGATLGSDYTVAAAGNLAIAGANLTLTFAQGNTSEQFTVNVLDDQVVEPDQAFTATITAIDATPGGVGGFIAASPNDARTVTITDDDTASFAITPASINLAEGTPPGAGSDLVYTVTRTAPAGGVETGLVQTVGFTATGSGGNPAAAGTDFTSITGSPVTFLSTDTTKTITVRSTPDAIVENDETLTVTASVADGGGALTTVTTAAAAGTIANDDATSFSIAVAPASRGEESGQGLVYTVTRTGSVAPGVVQLIDVTLAGTAVVADYSLSGLTVDGGGLGTLSFADTDTSKSFTVTPDNDTAVEGDETVSATLAVNDDGVTSAAAGAVIGTGSVSGTIVDDDKPTFDITVSAATASEAAPGAVVFTVTRRDSASNPTTDPLGDVDVTLVLSAPAGVGGATLGSDYTVAAAGNLAIAGSDLTLTFAQGNTSETFTVNVLDDQVVEPDQAFTATITAIDATPGGVGGTIAASPNDARTVTITDNDTASFAITPASISLAEGTPPGAGSDFVYTVTRTTPAGGVETGLVQSIGFAVAGTDFTNMTTSPLSFAAGDTTKTITVRSNPDSVVENDETFTVTTSVADGGGALTTVTTSAAVGTIANDDATSFSIAVAPASRGEESGQGLVYTVTRTGSVAPGVVQLIDVTLAGTATVPGNAGADYSLSGLTVNAGGLGTLSFGDADTSKSFTVTPVNDTDVERDETVSATLAVNDDGVSSGAAGAVIGTGSVSGTFVDDDKPIFNITASAATASEAAPGTVVFTVTRLDGASTPTTDPLGDVDVTLVLSAPAGVGGATLGSDYTVAAAGNLAIAGANLTLTFAQGNTSEQFTVNVLDDQVVEPDQAFTATITAIDASPGGVGGFIAASPNDARTVTITDDDTASFAITPASISLAEGTPPGAGSDFVYTVTRTAPAGGVETGLVQTVGFTALGSGGNPATAGTDFSAITASPVSFLSTDTTKTITVRSTPDSVVENDETFTVTASVADDGGALTAVTTAAAAGTITNDDATSFSIAVAPASRGEESGQGLVYTVTRTGTVAPGVVQLVDVTLSGDAIVPGNAGADYSVSGLTVNAGGLGTLSFADTDTSKTFTVTPADDTDTEGDETVSATLAVNDDGVTSGAAGAVIGTGSATGTIVDDDKPTYDITVSAATATEAAAGTVVFTVTRRDSTSNPTTDPLGDVDVTLVLSAPAGVGGATLGSDYTVAAAGNLAIAGSDLTLTFAQGNTSETFTVNVLDDQVVEPDQAFTATITAIDASPGGVGGTIAASPNDARTVTITDDDTASFAITPASISLAEGTPPGAGSDFVYTVTRTTPAGGVETGLVQTIDFTALGSGADPATAGTDFGVITTSPLSFAAGDTTKTITVRSTPDSLVESDETFTVTASVADGGGALTAVTTPTAGGTIANDDATSFSIAVAPASQGEESGLGLVYTVTRTGSVAPGVVQLIDVTLAGTTTVPGNAGADYSLSGLTVDAGGLGTLSFGDADSSKSFTVTPVNDTDVERDETVSATLAVNDDGVTSGAAGAVIGTGSVSGTFVDDDKPIFNITASAATASEAAPGTVVFTVTRLDGASTPTTDPLGEVDVTLVLSAPAGVGGATLGSDYTVAAAGNLAVAGANLTLTFAQGNTSETFTVNVLDDQVVEPDQAFTATITAIDASPGGVGGFIAASPNDARTVTITDDDTASFAISPASINLAEGTPPGAGSDFVYTVTRTTPAGGVETGLVQTVGFTTLGSGGNPATAGTDFSAITTSPLSFAAGDTTKTITVRSTPDSVVESDETFTVTASVADGGGALTAVTTPAAAGTIANDDATSFSIAVAPATRGEETGQGLVYTVTRTGSVAPGVVQLIDVTLAGTATVPGNAGADYSLSGLTVNAGGLGTLSFADTDTSKSFTVTPANDTVVEGDETVSATLAVNDDGVTSGAAGAVIGTGSVSGTIIDDDKPVYDITVSAATATEAAAGTVVFTVTRRDSASTPVADPLGDVDVTLVLSAPAGVGGATLGSDYTVAAAGNLAVAGSDLTLTFAQGNTSETFTVNVLDDQVVEPDQAFTATITAIDASPGGVGGTIAASPADARTVTITDNDTASFAISPASISLAEGTPPGAGSDFVYTVTRTTPAGGVETGLVQTVGFAALGSGANPATAGTDFGVITTSPLSFAAGDTTKTITVRSTPDATLESDETFTVTASVVDGGGALTAVTTPTAGGTIANDDETSFSIAVAPATRGEETGQGLVYTVTRTGSVAPGVVQLIDVTLAGTTTVPGNAGADYSLSGLTVNAGGLGTLSFADTDASKSFTVTPVNDTVVEGDETVSATLAVNDDGVTSGAAGAVIGTGSVTGTIVDDDKPVYDITVSAATATEAAAGTVVFTVTRRDAASTPVADPLGDVDVTLVLSAPAGVGGATLGSDYTVAAAGNLAVAGSNLTLTFAQGNTSETFTVNVLDDQVVEPDQAFTATITAIDASPGGVGGTIAASPNDAAMVTIQDNDTASFAIAPASISLAEGTPPGAGSDFVYTVTRTAPAGGVETGLVQTVGFTATGSGGNPATAGTDFSAITASPVTFLSTDTTKTITVRSTPDSVVENDETFTVTASVADDGGALTAVTTAAAAGTITNDDATSFSIAVAPASRGEESGQGLVYTVTRTGSVAPGVTQVLDVTLAGTATVPGNAGADYSLSGLTVNAGGLGTLTFNDTDTSKSFTVTPADDTAIEGDETVSATLAVNDDGVTSGAAGAVIGTGSVSGTIADDDKPTYDITVSAATATEAAAGTVVFTVTRRDSASTPVADPLGDVDVTLVLSAPAGVGGATLGSDYTVAAAGNLAIAGSDLTLTFAQGNTSETFTVNVLDDQVVEPDQAFTATITAIDATPGGVGGFIAASPNDARTVTIQDNDTASFAITPASISLAEGTPPGAGSDFVYTVTRTTPAGGVETGLVQTIDFTALGSGADPATAGTDFGVITTSPLSFAAGDTTKTITVRSTPDSLVESDETFTVTASVADGGGALTAVTTPTAGGTIANDDATSFSIAVAPASQGEESGLGLVYTVTRTGSVAPGVVQLIDVTLAGTATVPGNAGADYSLSGLTVDAGGLGTLSFGDADTSKTFTVTPASDTAIEGDETVSATLAVNDDGVTSGAAGAVIGTGSVIGTIIDDDKPVYDITVSAATATEAAAGTVVFTVTRRDAASTPVADPLGEVDVTLVLSAPAGVGGATLGSDYTVAAAGNLAVAGSNLTLTFAQGNTSETFTVNVLDDQVVEPDQAFTATITAIDASPGGVGGTIAASPNDARTVTITDNDTASFAITPASISLAEGTPPGAGSDFVYTVTRTAPAGGVETGLVQTVGFTALGSGGNPATAGTDFSAITASPVTFLSTDTTKTITVRSTPDSVVENDETFTVTASVADGGGALTTVTTAAAAGTITNDDATSFSIAVAPASRGEESGQGLVYTVTRTGSVAPGVTQVLDVTLAGTATVPGNAGADYSLSGLTVNAGGLGTLTFNDTDTSKSFTVTPADDTAIEGDETVSATLAVNDDGVTSGAAGAVIGTGSVSGTIADDDKPTYDITVSAATATEAAAGTVVFTVTRRDSASTPVADPLGDVDVTLVLSAPAGVGGATLGSDYTVAAAGNLAIAGSDLTLTFAQGNTSETFTVNVLDDQVVEPDQAFTATITAIDATPGGVGGFIAASPNDARTVTIQDNDTASFAITPASISLAEGTPPGAGSDFVYTVTRTTPAGGVETGLAQTIDFTALGSGADPATAGTDFGVITTSPLSFAAGDTTKTITVRSTPDSLVESDETFTVTASVADDGGALTAVTTPTAGGTIANDDATSFSIAVAPASQGEESGQGLVYTVTRTGSVAPGVVQLIDVTLAGDATVPGNAGADYAVSGLTVNAGGLGTLSFGDADTSKTFTVTPASDTAIEGDETVSATLAVNDDGVTSGAAGAVIGTGSVSGTIIDDDKPTYDITASAATATEAAAGTVVFTVTRRDGATPTTDPLGEVDVTLVLSAPAGVGGATLGSDYTVAAAGNLTVAGSNLTLRFAQGNTSETFTVNVLDDQVVEPDQAFTATITAIDATPGGVGGFIAASPNDARTVTITDNDTASFAITPASISLAEGTPPGAGSDFVYTVTRTTPAGGVETGLVQTIAYTAVGSGAIPATAGADFTNITGSPVTFLSTDTAKTITVRSTPDSLVENDETFTVTASVADDGGALTSVITPAAAGTISNDDATSFSVSVAPISVGEASGQGMVYTVTRTGTVQSGVTQTVDVTLSGSATRPGGAGADYSLAGLTINGSGLGTLTFASTDMTKTFTVTPVDEAVVESSETVVATLSNAQDGLTMSTVAGAVLGGTPATGTIIDDDSVAPPNVTTLDVQDFDGSASGMTAGIKINGEAFGDVSGSAVSILGDVNGDGRADIGIGAPGAAGGDVGRTYVIFGATTGTLDALNDDGGTNLGFELTSIDGSQGVAIDGGGVTLRTGGSAAGGDVNGDGFADVGFSAAPFNTAAPVPFGFTAFGGASFADLHGQTTANWGANGVQFEPFPWAAPMGELNVAIGDVTGDGKAEVLLGEPTFDSGGANDSGRVFLVYGDTQGALAALNPLTGSNGTAVSTLAGLTSNPPADGSKLGESVAVIGDINGDGYNDFVVGGANVDKLGGRAYVLFGDSQPVLAARLTNILDKTGGYTNGLESLNGGNGGFVVKQEGFNFARSFGLTATGIGDFNGDGLADFAVGGPDGGGGIGIVGIVYGRTNFAAAPFMDGLDVGSELTSTVVADKGFLQYGFALSNLDSRMGTSVEGLGDVNGDGRSDLLVGQGSTNKFFVLFGTTDVAPMLSQPFSGFGFNHQFVDPGSQAENFLTGNLLVGRGIQIEGFNNGFGFSGAGGGDVNGDGFRDIVLGNTKVDPSGTATKGDAGQSYVLYGQSFNNVVTPGSTASATAQSLVAGNGNVSLSSGTQDQISLQSGSGDDTLFINFQERHVDGGLDTSLSASSPGPGDTLAIVNNPIYDGRDLDFTSLLASGARRSAVYQGIERIDVSGHGSNTVSLDARDVLQIADTTHKLTILGDATDQVQSTGQGWTHSGPVGGFDVYTIAGSAATLLVDSTIPLANQTIN